jgi:hypothetical protein
MTGAPTTIIWNVQRAVLLHESVAVQETVLVPIGKVLPLAGLQTTVGEPQPPLTVGAKATAAPAGSAA